MKKSLIVLLSALAITAVSQEKPEWRIGIYLGSHGNGAKYSEGMSNANARFHQNKFGSGELGVNFRYDFDKHWMVTTGLGFRSVGFDYGIAENYSLLNKNKRFTGIKSEFGVIDIPAMVFYKFNPNCKGSRWLVGAGLAHTIVGDRIIDKNASQASDGGSSVNYISSTSTTKGGIYWNFRWSVGREKTFKNKTILNASVVFNYGFNQFAKSTVNYTIDNETYTHTFTNSGSFIGVRLTYLFKPYHSGACTSAVKKDRTPETLLMSKQK